MLKWGQRIKQLREQKNMTQAELADRLGTTIRTVRRWEKEEVVPDVFVAANLAKLLETTIEKIFKE